MYRLYIYIYKDVSAFLLLHFAAYLSKLGDDNKSYQQKQGKPPTSDQRPQPPKGSESLKTIQRKPGSGWLIYHFTMVLSGKSGKYC